MIIIIYSLWLSQLKTEWYIITTWKWRNKNTVSTWSCLFNFTAVRWEWKFSGPNLDNSSLHCLHKSKQVYVNKGSHTWVVLFITIVLFLRIKLFPQNLCLRSLENSSSVSKLDSRSLKIETKNSKLDSWKLWGSRIKFRVETVNLPLSGTVSHEQVNPHC